jgi:hypothetical protein
MDGMAMLLQRIRTLSVQAACGTNTSPATTDAPAPPKTTGSRMSGTSKPATGNTAAMTIRSTRQERSPVPQPGRHLPPRQKHLDQKLSAPNVTEIRRDWLMSRQQKTYSEQSMIRIIIIHPGHIRKEFTGFHIKF